MASTDSSEGKDREEFVVEASFYGDPPAGGSPPRGERQVAGPSREIR